MEAERGMAGEPNKGFVREVVDVTSCLAGCLLYNI